MKIIEKELSYKITGICFQIQNHRGRFSTERQYCDDFENEIKLADIAYLREKDIRNFNPDAQAGNRPDFIIEGKVAVDFKAKPYITKDDYNQMQR